MPCMDYVIFDSNAQLFYNYSDLLNELHGDLFYYIVFAVICDGSIKPRIKFS